MQKWTENIQTETEIDRDRHDKDRRPEEDWDRRQGQTNTIRGRGDKQEHQS